MPEQLLIFTESAWWLLPIIILSGSLSWLLYSKKNRPWSRKVNWLLASLRFLTISLTLSLLLNPVANLLTYEEERPIVALAIDNSESVLQNQDSSALLQGIMAIKEDLLSKNYIVEVYDLVNKNSLDLLSFSGDRTNLNQQLKHIENDFEDQNLAAIIQFTDGIVTNGYIPSRSTFGQPIHTIGVGDTIPPKDIKINSVVSNKIVYLGNLFSVKTLISATGFQNESVLLSIKKNGQKIQERSITLQEIQEVECTIDAASAGLYRFTVEVQTLEEEITSENNSFDFYVDIIDGKENILIVASSPHPDIRAIRSALEKSENYDTYLLVPGLNEKPENIDFDVIIYHDAFKNNENLRQTYGLLDIPTFYISTERPSPQKLTVEVNVSLSEFNNQTDNVTPALTSTFSRFKIDKELQSRFNDYPSTVVPFGEFTLNGPHDILLNQQVGRLVTSKPLLTYYDDGSKKFALMMGKGIWKWKLQEGAVSGDTELFDQIIRKTIQFLSIRNDKKQFTAVPAERLFEEGQAVKFNVEVYNSVYERVTGQSFNIMIQDEKDSIQNFEFFSNDQISEFSLGNLTSGTYAFEASTFIQGKKEMITGEFVVRSLQIETINQQADHQLLQRISRNTRGEFFHITELDKFREVLSNTTYPGIISSENEFIPLRKSIWFISLIFLLASIEWFLRKYLGSY